VDFDGGRIGNRRQSHQILGLGQLADVRPPRSAFLLRQLAGIEIAPGSQRPGDESCTPVKWTFARAGTRTYVRIPWRDSTSLNPSGAPSPCCGLGHRRSTGCGHRSGQGASRVGAPDSTLARWDAATARRTGKGMSHEVVGIESVIPDGDQSTHRFEPHHDEDSSRTPRQRRR
jgi:hypothetical protein